MIVIDLISIIITVYGLTMALDAKQRQTRRQIMKEITESQEAISKICREIAER